MCVNKKPSLSELTLREKIGQTALMEISMLINVENLKQYLKENPIGNVWHIGDYHLATPDLTAVPGGIRHDCKYYRKYCMKLRDFLNIPPLIGMDPPQADFATDIQQLTDAPAVGAANSVELAYKYGQMHAKVAKTAGANYSWGTVVDIPSRFNAVQIMRSMSDELDKLCSLSGAMIKAIQNEGVAATAKHFPGCDRSEYRDTHIAPASISLSLDEWRAEQGAAFQSMIDQGVYSIMVGHQSFPAVDDRKFGKVYVPATLSYNITTKLLKEEMGFSGIVITDGIGMAGLTAAYPDKKDRYAELINAGNDILLGVRDYDYIDIIEEAVKEGKISESRIDDACTRILNIKEKLGLFDEPVELLYDENLKNEIAETNKIIAETALTLECDLNNLLPLNPSKIKNVAIICSAHTDLPYIALEHMKKAFEERGMKVQLQRRLTSDEEIEKIANENDLIIYAGYIMPHAPKGASSFYDEECDTFFYAFTQGAEKSIGVSLGSVYVYYDFYYNAQTFIHAYTISREAMQAFVKAIFGEIPFKGTMPYIQATGRPEL